MESSANAIELEEKKESSQMESNNGDTNQHNNNNGKGGWLSSLLFLGSNLGLNIAAGAWSSNLIVFLISVFNLKHIPAAQINNIFGGLIQFFPLIAAVLADSFFGAFSISLISSIISLVGVLMFTFMVTIKSLRPPPCAFNSACVPPTTSQYSFLCVSLTLASLGHGGTKYMLGNMGADQFDKPKHQASFFNWFAFVLYISYIIGFTLLIYIQTSVSWVLSFAIALAANLIGIALLLAGSKIYRKYPPKGSPFTSIARVFVASFRNKNMLDTINEDDCYLYESKESKIIYGDPSKSLRFFNRAALINRGDNNVRGTEKKSWSQCTVEEVEDLKKLIKIIPLWSSSILLSCALGVILSFTVLVALVMDRHVASHFKIPAGSFLAIPFVFTAITSSILDRFIHPTYRIFTGRRLTSIQGIGICHVSNILSAIGFALIERRRLKLVEIYHLTNHLDAMAPLSALWLVFPLAIMGVGEGFYISQAMTLFYQEFPKSLRSTSTAMSSLHIAAGLFLSSAFIELVARTSSWLPNDINFGRVDNACWVLAIVATVNFAYFLVCALSYKYNNPDLASDNGQNVRS